jgi:AbrB family looped-hinge helix DNA binding protein
MSTATVTSDYKITLPKEIRDSMHLQPGQELELIQNGSGIQMVPKLTVEQLKAAVAQGLAGGPGIPADEAFDRLEEKYRKLATGK